MRAKGPPPEFVGRLGVPGERPGFWVNRNDYETISCWIRRHMRVRDRFELSRMFLAVCDAAAEFNSATFRIQPIQAVIKLGVKDEATVLKYLRILEKLSIIRIYKNDYSGVTIFLERFRRSPNAHKGELIWR
jgi:hypothetical protein